MNCYNVIALHCEHGAVYTYVGRSHPQALTLDDTSLDIMRPYEHAVSSRAADEQWQLYRLFIWGERGLRTQGTRVFIPL